MAEISIVYDQKTGEFLGVRLDGKTLEGEPAYKHVKHLSTFDWVQNEHVELYHRAGGSICSIHVLCNLYRCC
jgi:hypothetical protein